MRGQFGDMIILPIPHWKGPGGILKSAGFLGMNSSALLSWWFSLSLEGMVDDLNLSRRLLALRGHVGRQLPASLGGSQCWPWPQRNRLVRESARIFKDTTCHNVTLHFVWQFNIIHLLEPGGFLWDGILNHRHIEFKTKSCRSSQAYSYNVYDGYPITVEF